MNLVVDTNIVFSALLNPKSNIGDVLLGYEETFRFYAPEFLLNEIDKYSEKISELTKQSPYELKITKTLVLNVITFISEELIVEENWARAYDLVKEIDENDTPFIALAIQMNSKLWSGDKKLTQGLIKKKSDIILTTQDILKIKP
jgi:predicted nucleic acid-binding protein